MRGAARRDGSFTHARRRSFLPARRIDTFAKFLAPGLRLGWAVAAPAVAEKLTHLMQAQTLGPSGLSMVRGHVGIPRCLLDGG